MATRVEPPAVSLPAIGRAPAGRIRRRVLVQGVVQGVGFRPFVARLAVSSGLGGFVLNDGGGVVIEVEGPPSALTGFVDELRQGAPSVSEIRAVRTWDIDPLGDVDFEIHRSATDETDRRSDIPPDIGLCDACRAEVRERGERRCGYAFTNCTQCGPRYTIVESLPYDRERTSMRRFPLCEACRVEYETATDRRFHAEPMACAACGPRLTLTTGRGDRLAGDPIEEAAAHLGQGRVVAIKGVGGFQLAADARDGAAVAALRRGKRRPHKPLAVMVGDVDTARGLCDVSAREAAVLESAERPIVLLVKRRAARHAVGEAVAPGRRRLGVMLPTTPLHLLLLDAFYVQTGRRVLVMTSGNRSAEPIELDGDAARRSLRGIADAFLDHDRPILAAADDSVVRIDADNSAPTVIRSARGLAPARFVLGRHAVPPILACGADLKSAVCMTRGADAYLSPYLGVLGSVEADERLERTVAHMQAVLAIEPALVAVDAHPDARASRYGRGFGLPVVTVQHHHAHIVATMVEHAVTEPVIGLALDGVGYGSDRTIWGGEVLVADRSRFERAAHLETVVQPGGDAAAREPWRMALSHLVVAFDGKPVQQYVGALSPVGAERLAQVETLVRHGAAGGFAHHTSSAGRLFDAVAALLGLGLTNTFEGQAAAALEEVMHGESDTQAYPTSLDRSGPVTILHTSPMVRAIVHDLALGRSAATISSRFHRAVAATFAAACNLVSERHGIRTVALGGGVFQNSVLTSMLVRRLVEAGFRVLRPVRVPPSDGGIALGQAAVAAARHEAGADGGTPCV